MEPNQSATQNVASPAQTTPSPETTQTTAPATPEKKGHTGPVAGAFVIVVLLIAGALYFWGTKMNHDMNSPPYIVGDDSSMRDTGAQGEVTSDTGAGLPEQHDSDELSSIEADLNAMNFDQFESQTDAEVNNIQ